MNPTMKHKQPSKAAMARAEAVIGEGLGFLQPAQQSILARHDARMEDMFGDEFWSVKDQGDGVLLLNGFIGFQTYDELAKHVKKGGQKELRINSDGGIASCGVACYNMLRDANLQVTVDGTAFSAASVIAMGGNPVIMRRGSSIGIHRPWTLMIGNADDLREEAELLDTLGDTIFEVYAARIKGVRKLEEVKQAYQKDTLFGGKEAVRLGLADEHEERQDSFASIVVDGVDNAEELKERIQALTNQVKGEFDELPAQASWDASITKLGDIKPKEEEPKQSKADFALQSLRKNYV